MARLLVVDDDAVACRLLYEVLTGDGHEVRWFTDPGAAVDAVDEAPYEVAIVDVQMPKLDGIAVTRELRRKRPGLPVIIVTAFGSMQTAVQAFDSGAIDYVSKPMNLEELRTSVARALRRREVEPATPAADGSPLDQVIGRSPAMVEVYKLVAKVAPGKSTVLLLGESGTGKELVARAIHRHSPRCERPFVAVDCGSLSETLLESELFGHVRGAFTGAAGEKRGLLQEADGGTCLLDEIGDVSPGLQAKLLRFLQEQEIRRVGGQEWTRVDVRVVAATNKDLEALVVAGRFREDLYYRLKVVTIHLPPLRERRDDIPLLVSHFIGTHARQSGTPVTGIADDALALLRRYAWPGNIRELAHVIEQAVTLSKGPVLLVDDLPPQLLEPVRGVEGTIFRDTPSLAEMKERYIRYVLEHTGGNVSRSAEILQVDRRSLYRMLDRYGLAPSDARRKP
jgi:two-component system response regulator AtoC